MAYTNGFPVNYQQVYPQYNYIPQMPQQQIIQQPPQNDTGILWVQGEAGAKSWAVAPGKSVMLMDSESSTFYIKSSDMSGMPMPLRIFDYSERTQQTPLEKPAVNSIPEIDLSKFVTWDALDKRIDERLKKEINDGESSI